MLFIAFYRFLSRNPGVNRRVDDRARRNLPAGRQTGVIAQEVEALKEQQQQVNELREQVEELRLRLDAQRYGLLRKVDKLPGDVKRFYRPIRPLR